MNNRTGAFPLLHEEGKTRGGVYFSVPPPKNVADKSVVSFYFCPSRSCGLFVARICGRIWRSVLLNEKQKAVQRTAFSRDTEPLLLQFDRRFDILVDLPLVVPVGRVEQLAVPPEPVRGTDLQRGADAGRLLADDQVRHDVDLLFRVDLRAVGECAVLAVDVHRSVDDDAVPLVFQEIGELQRVGPSGDRRILQPVHVELDTVVCPERHFGDTDRLRRTGEVQVENERSSPEVQTVFHRILEPDVLEADPRAGDPDGIDRRRSGRFYERQRGVLRVQRQRPVRCRCDGIVVVACNEEEAQRSDEEQ